MKLLMAIRPFERGRVVDLQEAGWTFRWIAAHVGHNIIAGALLL